MGGDGECVPAETAPAAANKGGAWLVLAVAFALFADAVLLTVIVPLAPDMLPNETSTKVGVLFASKAAVQILANPAVGYLSDSVLGPQLCLQIGLLILAASTCGFAFADTYLELLAARGVQGIASSLVGCGGMSMVAMAYPPDERGSAAGQAQAGIAAGVLLGPAIGGALGSVEMWSEYPHATPFVAVAGVVLADLVVQAVLSKAKPVAKHVVDPEDQSGMLALAKDSQVLSAMVCMFAANTAVALIEPLVPYYLKHNYHYSKSQRGFLWMAAPGAYLVTTPFAGMLADKVPKWTLLAVGLLVSGATLPWACFFPDQGVWITAVAIACVGVGTSLVETPIQPILSLICDARHQGAYGSAFALNDVAMSLGFIVGPIVGSALKQEFGVKWTLFGTGVFLLVLLPASLHLRGVKATPQAERLLPASVEGQLNAGDVPYAE
eukprot:TRINITY_DN17358_c0_g8_i1.p1 TRINITY_DN17358_c0_g8~~TRINITY_DN17358_c0_g8_i1.p1  ORF type:complete len:460 (+),score=101.55 TRINITY_DN17358_c0_g8_i1:68-1381(+)